MIQTKNVSFQFDKRGEIFHFPDIVLKKEEHLLILGKSGIGKTTLLHLMAGLLRPKTGKIIVEGKNLPSLSNKQLDQFTGAKMGLVFQQNLAIRSLNVVENLQARLFFSQKKSDSAVLSLLLEQLNLSENKHQKPNELSEGQLQRLGIALAVVHSPKVILADEPTSSLDDEHCRDVMNLLKEQSQKNKANLVVITHDQRVKPLFQNVLTL